MKKTITILLIFYQTISFAQHSISFPKEYIDFYLDSKYFSINGLYVFKNETNQYVKQSIDFPFATKVSSIDSIRVIDLKKIAILHFNRTNSGISFDINLLPKDTLLVNIFYRQPKEEFNTYILSTAKKWGKPFEYAAYSLSIDKNIKIDSLSYNPDSSLSIDDKVIFKWEKYNFLPEKEFVVITKN